MVTVSFGTRIVQPKFDPAACVRTWLASPENVTVVVPAAATVNAELVTGGAVKMLTSFELAKPAPLGVPVAAQPHAP